MMAMLNLPNLAIGNFSFIVISKMEWLISFLLWRVAQFIFKLIDGDNEWIGQEMCVFNMDARYFENSNIIPKYDIPAHYFGLENLNI